MKRKHCTQAAEFAVQNLQYYLTLIREHDEPTPTDIGCLNVLHELIKDDILVLHQEQNACYDDFKELQDQLLDDETLTVINKIEMLDKINSAEMLFEHWKFEIKKANYIIDLCQNQQIYLKEKQLRRDYFKGGM